MGKEQRVKHVNGQVIPFIQNGEYYFNKGLKAYHQSDLKRALKHMERAVRFEPEEPVFTVQLAVIHAELGNYSASNEHLFHVLDTLDPEMVECYYFLANNFAHIGVFQEALKYAKRYIKEAPDGEFAEDTLDLLDVLSMDGEAEEHELDLETEDDLIMKQEQAREQLEEGDFEGAITVLEDIITDYPEFWSSYNNLSLAYFYSGETDKAMQVIEDVLDKNPGNLHALCNLAVFSHYLQVENKVKMVMEQLKSVYPMHADHRFKLGATFALTGYYPEAYKWLRWLDKHGFEGDGSFYYWLAVSAHGVGYQHVAERAWKTVVERNPQKQGKEPWRKSTSNQETNPLGASFDELKHHETFLNMLNDSLAIQEEFETKLYALMLLGKIKSEEAYQLMKHFAQQDDEELVLKEFAAHMLHQIKPDAPVLIVNQGTLKKVTKIKNRNVVSLAEAAALLFEKNNPSLELPALHELIVSWSHLATALLSKKMRVVNSKALAAALEYVWNKDKQQKLTQTDAANKYEISAGTVSKYVKLVNNILS